MVRWGGAVSYERGTPLRGKDPSEPADKPYEPRAQSEYFIDNLLIRIHHIIEMFGGPASRHGSLNSLFQEARIKPLTAHTDVASLGKLRACAESLARAASGTFTGAPHLQENAPPQDPTVGLCLRS